MAAGYRTAQPQFVDNKMMQLPWELMARVIEKQDEEIDLSMGEASAIDDMLNIKSLHADKARAQEILQGYESQVDELTQNILKNPLEHQKQLYKIRNLSKNINKDMTAGEWAAIEGNYTQHMAEAKRIAELKNEDGYDDTYKSLLVQDSLKKYQGANYQANGSYNQYGTIEALALEDLNTWVDGRLKDAIPDAQEIEQDKINGGWIVTTKEGVKRMSQAELDTILKDSFNGAQGLQAAIKQRARLGMEGFEGLITDDGSFAPISGMVTEKLTGPDGKEVEVPRLAFADNMLGSAFRAGVNKFGFEQTTFSQTRDADPYSLAAYKSNLIERREKAKEEKQTDYLRLVNGETISSYVPATSGEFNEEVKATAASIVAIKDKATTYLKNAFGKELSQAEQDAINIGDFSVLLDADIPEETVAQLEGEYQRELIKQVALAGAEKTWKAQMKAEYDESGQTVPFEDYLTQNKAKFATFLNDNHNKQVDIAFTWEGTGLDNTAIKTFQKNVVDGGLYGLATFEYNGKTTTLNELIRTGVVEPEQVKVGSENDAISEEFNKLAAIPATKRTAEQATRYSELRKHVALSGNSGSKISYKFKDGSGYINFDIGEQSIMPATALNNENEIDIGMKIDISGRPLFATISSETLTSSGIETFKRVNASELNFNRDIAKMANYNNMEFPHGPGIILNPKDKTIILGPNKPPIPITHGQGRSYAKRLLGYQ